MSKLNLRALGQHRYLLAVLGLALLAFLLRAYRLDFQSFWIDEVWTVYYARLTMVELMERLHTVEPHPPLYYPIITYWRQWVGDSEYALRFYSLVFGVLAVPLAYRLGRDLGDRRLGLLAALLLAAAPFQIWHSQEARMYTALTATGLASMVSFINLWQRGGRRWWVFYILTTIWAVMTHYHAVILIGSQGLFLLLTWRRHWRRYPAWGGALLAVLLLSLPWLSFSWQLLRHRTSWTAQPTLWAAYARSAVAYSVGEQAPQPLWPTMAFAGLFGLGLVYAARRRWRNWPGPVLLALLVAYTLAPIMAAWIYGEWRTPVYLERYLIPVQAGYLLAVAAGILAVADSPIRPKWLRQSLAAGLLLLLLALDGWVLGHYYYNPAYARDDWRAVARRVEAFGQPGDAVVVTGDGGEKAFDYYYRGDLPVYFSFNTPVPSEAEARQIMAGIAHRHRRFWYTPYGAPIDATLESWMAGHAYPAWQSWLGRKRLALYAGSSANLSRREEPGVTLEDGPEAALVLTQVALSGAAVPAGDLLPLALTWQTTTGLARDYGLSLRLINSRGDSFAQSDWPPLAAAGPTSTWPPGRPITDQRSLWLPPDTPPGNYALQLVVYDPMSGRPMGQPVILPDIPVGPAEITPPLAALPRPNPTRQPLGDITLVGYALPEEIRPGETMWAWLYWQAETTPAPDSRLFLWLQGEGSASGETAANPAPLVDSVGPLESWRPGQVRRAIYYLPTPPQLRGEQAVLKAALAVGQSPAAEAALAPVRLRLRPRQFTPPPISRPLEAEFGRPALVRLLGYDLPADNLTPGAGLSLTLYWQAAAVMPASYTIFIQLLNDQDQVVAQVDALPQAGAAPTTTWLPGEILADPYHLALPAGLPPGQYRLIAGLYDAVTGERLPVAAGGDFVELPSLRVK